MLDTSESCFKRVTNRTEKALSTVQKLQQEAMEAHTGLHGIEREDRGARVIVVVLRAQLVTVSQVVHTHTQESAGAPSRLKPLEGVVSFCP